MSPQGRTMLGVMLPIGMGALGDGQAVPWTVVREMATAAEAIGLDNLVVPDHLVFRKSPPTNNPVVEMPEGHSRGIWEAWTILSALAAVTRRVTLGPFVACTAFRHPALLAKMAATLDEVSGGRLVLGLGAGWHEPEFHAFGYPFDHRVSRFEEALQIIVPLLREGRVDFQGQYYQVRDCEIQPRGPRPGGPPIFIGASGPRMLRLIARYADRYDTDFQLDPAGARQRFDALDGACAEVGRDPASIRRSTGVRLAIVDPGDGAAPAHQIGRAENGFAHYNLAGARFTGRTGTPEDLAEYLRTFVAAGAEQITCTLLHPVGVRGIERFARVVELMRR